MCGCDVLPLDGSVRLETHVLMSLLCLRHEKLLYLFDSIVGLVECEGEFGIPPTRTMLPGGLHAS